MNTESSGSQTPAQQEQFEKLIADLKAVLRDGQELLKISVGTVKERALSGAQATERLVRERPYQSLGVVFGLGVLVGVVAVSMFSRNCGDKE